MNDTMTNADKNVDALLDLVHDLCGCVKTKFSVTDLDAEMFDVEMGFDDIFDFMYIDNENLDDLLKLMMELTKIKDFKPHLAVNGWFVKRLDIDAEDD